MPADQNFRNFRAWFLEDDFRIARHASIEGWVRAFFSGRYLEVKGREFREIWEEEYPELSPAEKENFAAFVFRTLQQAAPTEESDYYSYISRDFFNEKLHINHLGGYKETLEKFHKLRQEGGIPRVPPYERLCIISRGSNKKPLSGDPLKAFRYTADLEDYVDLCKDRREFAAAGFEERDRDHLKRGVGLLHHSERLRVYLIVSHEAAAAYEKGTRWWVREDEPVRLLQVEIAGGARFRIDGSNASTTNEKDDDVNLCGLLRAYPEILDVIRQVLPAEQDERDYAGRRFYEAMHGLPHAPSFFSEGALARSFEKRFEGLIEDARESIARGEEEDDAQTGHFENASRDVQVLAGNKAERRLVSGRFIAEIVATACAAGSAAEAQRILAIASKVPEWRKEITGGDIMPLLGALAAENYGSKRFMGKRALSHMLCHQARDKNWRNGDEAAFVPVAIGYLLREKNWAQLQTILRCATREESWRKSIDRNIRDTIRLHRFDNAYKRFCIDVLIQRLEALDAGEPVRCCLGMAKHASAARRYEDGRNNSKRKFREKIEQVAWPACG